MYSVVLFKAISRWKAICTQFERNTNAWEIVVVLLHQTGISVGFQYQLTARSIHFNVSASVFGASLCECVAGNTIRVRIMWWSELT